MRIIYSVMGLTAVMNLLTVLQLTSHYNYLQAFTGEQLQSQVMIALRSFRDDWSFSFAFFGIYLVLLGYLAFVSGYVSKPVGICLVVAGTGWLSDSLQPFFISKSKSEYWNVYGFWRTGIYALVVYKRCEIKRAGLGSHSVWRASG